MPTQKSYKQIKGPILMFREITAATSALLMTTAIAVAQPRPAFYAVDADVGNVPELSPKDVSVLRRFTEGGELHGMPTFGRDIDGSNHE